MSKSNEEIIKAFRDEFQAFFDSINLPDRYNEQYKIEQFLISTLEAREAEVRAEYGGWVCTEVHERSGQTTIGQPLYWAKVRSLTTPSPTDRCDHEWGGEYGKDESEQLHAYCKKCGDEMEWPQSQEETVENQTNKGE